MTSLLLVKLSFMFMSDFVILLLALFEIWQNK